MKATSIICVGNRYVAGDDVGCRVFDHLRSTATPPDIEVIDGGLCGLDLLGLMEGRRRVVFADAVVGLIEPGGIVVLDREQVALYAVNYGHSAGLPYLLHMLPHTCRPPWPEIALVGVEGAANEAMVRALAKRCMEIAINGIPRPDLH
ncbi:MAG: hydrogenase maturation protease [Proteobacteria bacterium]|nr:hydrogenase maturation protease [Pseudomonadota bacterium]